MSLQQPYSNNSLNGVQGKNTDLIDPVDQLIDEEMEREYEPDTAPTEPGLFTIQPADQWVKQASTRPVPRMLFGELWYEFEICILFADTNVGKSILAVQIADSITQARAIAGIKLEAEQQSVLYFDFELSDKQFEARYSIDYSQHYHFNNLFLRAEINPDSTLPDSFKSFEAYLNYSLEQAIISTGTRILIIDNLTYLSHETERAKDALPLMKHVKALRKKYNLSILCLAHTPKRDMSKPLTRNDLQGSKMLINFSDTSFAVGESTQDKQVRYIKQIKERSTTKLYGEENVMVCQLAKPSNFLQFEFLGYGREGDHLRPQTQQDRTSQTEKILDLHRQGRSLRSIASEIGVSHQTVKRCLAKPPDGL